MNSNDCGCCAGVTEQTDVALTNRPGLTALAYRVGTHAQFKQRMLARLSAAERSALAGLQTRQDDDFAIALLDAWATVADVLTFYQERIANESYLRTATERLSLVHLARLIGYELQPGVAASTYLAFTLEEAPGAPPRTTIDSGVKVQSIPGPGEKPQTFETVETIEARPTWNALKPRSTGPQRLAGGLMELYLVGVDTQLHPGDGIVVVGEHRWRVSGPANGDSGPRQGSHPHHLGRPAGQRRPPAATGVCTAAARGPVRSQCAGPEAAQRDRDQTRGPR